MRRLVLTVVMGMLLVVTSGCRVLPDIFPSYRPCDSFRDCWRTNVRRPADWCWGNCPVVHETDG